MKPPPRKRKKPARTLQPEPAPPVRKQAAPWKRNEQTDLLKALKRLRRTSQSHEAINYDFLRKSVPTRSISEISSVVEFLKNKVISSASFKLKKRRWEEKKLRKPIEVWTHMASALAGTHEESISTAFSQMLTVSSTEPRTLRNCDPPLVHRPPTGKDRPAGRTVPLRPMPRLPVKVERPDTTTARPVVLKTPAPAQGPARRLPAPSQVLRVPNSRIPPPQQQLSTTPAAASASCQPAAAQIPAPPTPPQPAPPATEQVTPSSGSAAAVETTTSTSKSSSSAPPTPLSSSSAASQTPLPGTAAPSSARPAHPLSAPAAAFHTRFGRTSKYATKDSPRVFGVKSVVDFERIYRYLSDIHQPNDECHLTPMESAIVLDLLMSLPEELPLLDCNKLHKHLIQVYQVLSSTADSNTARQMLKQLKDGLSDQTPRAPDSSRTSGPQNAAGTTCSGDVTDSAGKNLQPGEAESQSTESNNASGQSGDADVMGLLPPPLNPFMVPLKLLKRK